MKLSLIFSITKNYLARSTALRKKSTDKPEGGGR